MREEGLLPSIQLRKENRRKKIRRTRTTLVGQKIPGVSSVSTVVVSVSGLITPTIDARDFIGN